MSEREVYPNPPVVLVALEIRHPATESLTPPELKAMRERLRQHVPITTNASALNAIVVPGSQGSTQVERFPRLVDRANTLAMSFRQEAIVIETSVYPGWEAFKAVVADAVQARIETASIEGVLRVGIRYIDEIRVTSSSPDIEWAEWVQPQLLGPRANADPLPLARWQGLGLYGQQPGHVVIFRYGPMDGSALPPQFELRRRKSFTPGPFFLMDIDSAWVPDDGVPEADPEMLMDLCEKVHKPVSVIFENSITDQLREVFRRDA